jgi:hypothetical protein
MMAERKRRSERNMMAQGYVPQQQPIIRQQEYYQPGTYQTPEHQQAYRQPQYRPEQQAYPYQEAKARRSKLLLIGGIIGLAYFIYIISYIINTANSIGTGDTVESAAQALGTGLAMAMITPHTIIVGFAVLFNCLSWALNKGGFALTGGILYCIAGFFMFVYIPFVLPSLILSFIGYAKLHKSRR